MCWCFSCVHCIQRRTILIMLSLTASSVLLRLSLPSVSLSFECCLITLMLLLWERSLSQDKKLKPFFCPYLVYASLSFPTIYMMESLFQRIHQPKHLWIDENTQRMPDAKPKYSFQALNFLSFLFPFLSLLLTNCYENQFYHKTANSKTFHFIFVLTPKTKAFPARLFDDGKLLLDNKTKWRKNEVKNCDMTVI